MGTNFVADMMSGHAFGIARRGVAYPTEAEFQALALGDWRDARFMLVTLVAQAVMAEMQFRVENPNSWYPTPEELRALQRIKC